MCLQFGFLIFWQKNIGAKAAHDKLVKLQSTLSQQKLPHFVACVLYRRKPLVLKLIFGNILVTFEL